jgi:hypothetical protein
MFLHNNTFIVSQFFYLEETTTSMAIPFGVGGLPHKSLMKIVYWETASDSVNSYCLYPVWIKMYGYNTI